MQFENLVIFVSDSLRLDSTPGGLDDLGIGYETIAQSTHSPPSFTTLSTGLYPRQHGVHGWTDRIPENLETIFDTDTHDTGYFQSGNPTTDPMYTILGVEESRPLSKLESPFIYMERHDATHVPFGGTDADSFEDYFETRGGDYDRIKREYEQSADIALERFQEILNQLDRAGELDRTLAVFTSDHGELLGEFGDVAHSTPITPQLVYVPTYFVNPNLTKDDFATDPAEGMIEHVDLVKTYLDAIDIQLNQECPGTNIFNDRRQKEFGLASVKNTISRFDVYSADSIWWPDGGYEFCSNTRTSRLGYVLYRLLFGSESAALRADSSLLKTYVSSVNEYGVCETSAETARKLLRQELERMEKGEAGSFEITDEQQDRLKDLGYLE